MYFLNCRATMRRWMEINKRMVQFNRMAGPSIIRWLASPDGESPGFLGNHHQEAVALALVPGLSRGKHQLRRHQNSTMLTSASTEDFFPSFTGSTAHSALWLHNSHPARRRTLILRAQPHPRMDRPERRCRIMSLSKRWSSISAGRVSRQ